MNATIYDIAKESGFSPSTVSLALNDNPKIREETKKKIRQVADRLGYTPNYSARSLITQGTGSIGVIAPNLSNPFYCTLVDSLEQAAAEMGYTVILGLTEASMEKERKAIRMLAERRVDGLILAPTFLENIYPAEMQSQSGAHVPVVLCGNDSKAGNLSCVRCDNEAGGYLATEHLIKTGRRRIACISAFSEGIHGTHRISGYKKALADYGIEDDPALLYSCKEDPALIRAAAISLVREQKADGIFCLYDRVAVSVLAALANGGVSVPGDVGVIGYDDIAIASLLPLPLSTVDSKAGEIGREALNLLSSIIQKKVLTAQKILLKPELKIRSSTVLIE